MLQDWLDKRYDRESYDSDNLITCRFCDRDFCYHCGDSGDTVCLWCLDKQWASQLPMLGYSAPGHTSPIVLEVS
jgi:hypothetical protein